MTTLSRRSFLAASAAAALPLLSPSRALALIDQSFAAPTRILDVFLYGHRLEAGDSPELQQHASLARLGSAAAETLRPAGMLDVSALVAVRHELAAHELLAPLSITGTKLGSPGHAGLGAQIETRRQRAAPREVPYSYVLVPADMGAAVYVRSAAMAAAPGELRPLLLRLTSDSADPFARRASPDARDAICERFEDDGRRVSTAGSPTALDAARLLLTHEEHPAHYVFVADEAAAGETAPRHLASALDRVLDQLDAPGEDQGRIGLDQTLVVIHLDVAAATRGRRLATGFSILIGAATSRSDWRSGPFGTSSATLRRRIASAS